MKLDFLSSQPQYFDHLSPIWNALPHDQLGTFYVPNDLLRHALSRLEHRLFLQSYDRREFRKPSDYSQTVRIRPILVAAFGDLLAAHQQNDARRILYMEHGIGHTFHTPAYPDGPGKRDWVYAFLPPNQYTLDKIKQVRPTHPCEVIGTPKTDWIVNRYGINPLRVLKGSHYEPPIIGIGFHWGSRRNHPPESGSAFEHYKEYIPTLAKHYKLLAYGHPLSKEYPEFYKSIGVEYTTDFHQVMWRADVLLNDLSSVMYEFLLTGKPVVVLNAPWFRREVYHGLRFWDYSNIGINVEEPKELPWAIQDTLDNYPTIHMDERNEAIQDLYPYPGESAARAVQVIKEILG